MSSFDRKFVTTPIDDATVCQNIYPSLYKCSLHTPRSPSYARQSCVIIIPIYCPPLKATTDNSFLLATELPSQSAEGIVRLSRQVSEETCRNRLPAARHVREPGFVPRSRLQIRTRSLPNAQPKPRVGPLGQAGAAGVWGTGPHGRRSQQRGAFLSEVAERQPVRV